MIESYYYLLYYKYKSYVNSRFSNCNTFSNTTPDKTSYF